MSRHRLNRFALLALTVAIALPHAIFGQAAAADRRTGRMLVESYTIDAEINPKAQTLAANVQVRATPQEDNQSTATFELNNALSLTRVIDGENRQISSRSLTR
jgi:hypothetical protein